MWDKVCIGLDENIQIVQLLESYIKHGPKFQ